MGDLTTSLTYDAAGRVTDEVDVESVSGVTASRWHADCDDEERKIVLQAESYPDGGPLQASSTGSTTFDERFRAVEQSSHSEQADTFQTLVYDDAGHLVTQVYAEALAAPRVARGLRRPGRPRLRWRAARVRLHGTVAGFAVGAVDSAVIVWNRNLARASCNGCRAAQSSRRAVRRWPRCASSSSAAQGRGIVTFPAGRDDLVFRGDAGGAVVAA